MSEYGEDVVKAAEQAFQSPTTLVYKRRVKHVHYVATRAADELFRSPTYLASKRSMRSGTSPKKSRENRIRELLDPRYSSPLRSTQYSSPLRSTQSTLSAETTTPNIYSDLSRHSSVGRRYQSLIQNADQKALFHQMQNSLVVQLRASGEKKEKKKTETSRVKSQQYVYCGGCTDMILSRHSGEDSERQVPEDDDSDNSILLPSCHGRRQPRSPKRRREIPVSFEESSSWSTKSTRSATAPSVVTHNPSSDEQMRASSHCEADDSVLKSRKQCEKKLMSYALFFQCTGSDWSQPIDSPKHEPLPTLREDGFDDAVCNAQCDQAEGKAESSVESIVETREESQDTNRSEGAVERLASPIITASSVDGQQVEMSVKPSSSTLELETDGTQGDSCSTSSDMSTGQSFQSSCDVDEKHSIEQVESEILIGCDVNEKPSSEQVNSKSNVANPPDGSEMSTCQSLPRGLSGVDEKPSSEQVESKSNVVNPPDGKVLSGSTDQEEEQEELVTVQQRPSFVEVSSIDSPVGKAAKTAEVEVDSCNEQQEELVAVQQRPSFVEVSSIDSPVGKDAKTAEVEVDSCNEHTTSVKADEKSDDNKVKASTVQCSDEEVGRLPSAEIDPSMEKAIVETKDIVSEGPLSEPPVDQKEHVLRIDPSMEKAIVETKDIVSEGPLSEPPVDQNEHVLRIDPSMEKADVETKDIVSEGPLSEPPVDQKEHVLRIDPSMEKADVETKEIVSEGPLSEDIVSEGPLSGPFVYQKEHGLRIDPSMENANVETKDIVSEGPLSEPPVYQKENVLRSYPSDEFSPRARGQREDKGSKADTLSAQSGSNKVSEMLMSKPANGESIIEVSPDDSLQSDSQESSVTLKAGTRSCTSSVGNSRESTPKGGSPKTGTLRTVSSPTSPIARTPRSGTSRSGTPIEPWVNKDGPVEETDDDMHLVFEVLLPKGEAIEVKFSPEGRVHPVLLSPKERDGALSPKEMEFLPALFDTRSDPSNENQMSWSPDSGVPETGRSESPLRNIHARIQHGHEMFTFSEADVKSEPSSTQSISALRVSPAEYVRKSPSSSSNDASSLEAFDRLVSPSSGGSADEVECDDIELRKMYLRSLIQRLTALPTLADDQRPETPIPLRSYTELGITQDLPPQKEHNKDHDLITKSFRQRDESAKDDLSFMVKAKLVSEFFRSRIVSGEGSIRIEAGDRELFEDLLPASEQLHFIESLRFRVGALSETPTTLLQRLTLRCKKLGLHRKGAKNPILAAMALTDRSVNIRVDASSGEDDLLSTDSVPSSPHIEEVAATRSGSDSDLAVHLATFDRLMAMPYRSKSVAATGESQLEQIDTWESSLDNLEAFRGTLQRVSALATLSEDNERSSPFQGYADLGITENPTISFDLKSDITNVLEGHTPTEPSVQDLRDHDFAYLITASMLVKFFQSRIDFGEGRITLKPEDRITFEQLFPRTSILNFVDTVRFRLKEVPVYPVTHVDLVTVQCQKLGLNREGSENPIFVTLSLTNEPAFVDVTSLVGEVDDDWNAKFQASISPTSQTLGTYFLSVFSADKGMISPLNSMCMSPTVRSPTAMSTLAVLEEEKTVDTETNRDSFQSSSTEKHVTDRKVVDISTPPPRNITLMEVFHETDIQVKAVELGLTLHNRPSDEVSADQSATKMKELEEDEIILRSSSSRSKATHGDLKGDISSNLSKTLSSCVRGSSIVPSYSSDDECSDDESDDECSVEGMGSVFDDPPSISDLEGSGSSGDDALARIRAAAIQDPSKTASVPVLKKKDSGDGLEMRFPFPFGSGSSEEGLGMWGYVLDSHLFVVRSEEEEMRSRHSANSICSVERGLDHIWSGVEEWRETVSMEDNEYWTWEGASDTESNGEFWTTCSVGSYMKYRPSCCNPTSNTQSKIPLAMFHKKGEEFKNHCPSQESNKIRDEQHSFFNKMEKIWLTAFGSTKKTKSAMSADDSTTNSLPDIIGAYACFQAGDVPSYTNCSTDDFSLTPSRVSTASRTAPDSPWHIILPSHFTKCADKNDFDLQDDDSILVDDEDDDDDEEEQREEEEEEINLEESSASSWSRVSYYSESSADPFSSPWKPIIPILRCKRSKLALRKAKLGRPSLIADSPKSRRKRGVIL